ncbi:MAG: hypothetical protein GTO24_12815 [candidate division Zixibacteria bacterium]|nr:hypothetical protein [candidate division Zixibacteria bacterium]
MSIFTKKDIDRIADCLKAEGVRKQKDNYRIRLIAEEGRRTLILEIYPEVTLGKGKGPMVVVYTSNAHLQLHSCSGYVTSDELGEVTFVGESAGKISGLVVESQAACSLYANVKREVLSGDFTKLGVEVMLSGVALSLAEEIIEKGKEK